MRQQIWDACAGGDRDWRPFCLSGGWGRKEWKHPHKSGQKERLTRRPIGDEDQEKQDGPGGREKKTRTQGRSGGVASSGGASIKMRDWGVT